MIYFIVMCIFGGLLLWISETGDISYTDALATITSAMCVTGLSIVNVYQLSVVSQFIIMLWILLGSTVFMRCVFEAGYHPVLITSMQQRRAPVHQTAVLQAEFGTRDQRGPSGAGEDPHGQRATRVP